MIELSKCPNCASDDKVTIAGKDFCMRCGTPAADTTSVPDPVSSQQPIDQAQPSGVSAETTASSSVTKFNDSSAIVNTQQPVPDQPLAPEQNVATVAPSVATNPVAVTAPVPTVLPPQQPIGEPVAQPSFEPAMQQAAPATYQMPPVPSTDPAILTAQPQAMAQPIPEANNPVLQQASSQIAQPTSLPEPTVIVPTATQQPEAIADNLGSPGAVPTPEPMQLPADQPLTQPQAAPTPQAIPQVEQPVDDEPKIHTHQVVMNLDKNDNGVFSDEQLDELSKISDQNEQLAGPGSSKLDHTEPGSTRPNTIHTDIQPPANTPRPATDNISAVSKVVENDIKLPSDNKSKKMLKPAGIGLSIVALFLVGAYIWQVNYPTLAFKIASAKAGMGASMPGYIPGGYKLAGEIQTNPGAVSYNLINDGQNKKILISQTKTDWDSQALAENYVAPKAENYLALQAQGLTIYMLGDKQATWVNKGTWYKIESSDQSLSQDQAIKIATSL